MNTILTFDVSKAHEVVSPFQVMRKGKSKKIYINSGSIKPQTTFLISFSSFSSNSQIGKTFNFVWTCSYVDDEDDDDEVFLMPIYIGKHFFFSLFKYVFCGYQFFSFDLCLPCLFHIDWNVHHCNHYHRYIPIEDL